MNSDGSPNTGAVASALDWLQGTLLGSFAATIAVIVVGGLGLLLLAGRIPIRRAIEVVFGCFILFGASSIAAGIMRSVNGSSSDSDTAQTLPPPPMVEAPVETATTPHDPNAGAAVPPRP